MNYGRPSPEEMLRRVRLNGVAVLGFGVHGALLLNALEDPPNAWSWIFYGVYTALYIVGLVMSVRRDKRSREAESEAHPTHEGRDRPWF